MSRKSQAPPNYVASKKAFFENLQQQVEVKKTAVKKDTSKLVTSFLKPVSVKKDVKITSEEKNVTKKQNIGNQIEYAEEILVTQEKNVDHYQEIDTKIEDNLSKINAQLQNSEYILLIEDKSENIQQNQEDNNIKYILEDKIAFVFKDEDLETLNTKENLQNEEDIENKTILYEDNVNKNQGDTKQILIDEELQYKIEEEIENLEKEERNEYLETSKCCKYIFTF